VCHVLSASVSTCDYVQVMRRAFCFGPLSQDLRALSTPEAAEAILLLCRSDTNGYLSLTLDQRLALLKVCADALVSTVRTILKNIPPADCIHAYR
jgi:hypothetical protein